MNKKRKKRKLILYKDRLDIEEFLKGTKNKEVTVKDIMKKFNLSDFAVRTELKRGLKPREYKTREYYKYSADVAHKFNAKDFKDEKIKSLYRVYKKE